MNIRKILSCGVALLTFGIAWAQSYQELWTKGFEEFRAGKYADAAATLEAAAKLAETPAQKYQSIYHYGMALRHQNNHVEAAKVFGELLEVDGLSDAQKNTTFSQYLHNVYWQRGDKYQEVIDIAEKTFADPQASDSFKTTSAYLGYLSHNVLKQYPEAQEMGRKLAELNSEGIWHNRGLIYQATALRNQQKYDEALAMLPDDAVAKMHPHRQGEALLERAHSLRTDNKFPESIVDYTRVYELEGVAAAHRDLVVGHVIMSLNSAKQFDEIDVWIGRIDDINNKYWKSFALLRAAQSLQGQGKLADAKAKYQAMIDNGDWWKEHGENQIRLIDQRLGQ